MLVMPDQKQRVDVNPNHAYHWQSQPSNSPNFFLCLLTHVSTPSTMSIQVGSALATVRFHGQIEGTKD